MSELRWAVSFAVLLLLMAAAFARASFTPPRCSAPQETTRFRVTLSNTSRAVHSGKTLVIVAIGSSSTQGVGASDPGHTYPALLGEELRHRWPQLDVNVINKGVGGEIASEMLSRFGRDVLPYHSQLVIWQTGSNQVLRGDSIAGYADTIRQGVSRLKAEDIDIVLMDPQFAPRVLARPMHARVIDSIAAVANEMKVAVFRRFAVMRQWIASGQYKMQDIISSDGLHMNDVSYSCMARLLADSVAAAIEPETRVGARSVPAREENR